MTSLPAKVLREIGKLLGTVRGLSHRSDSLAYEQFAILDLVQHLADIRCVGGLEYDFEVRRLY